MVLDGAFESCRWRHCPRKGDEPFLADLQVMLHRGKLHRLRSTAAVRPIDQELRVRRVTLHSHCRHDGFEPCLESDPAAGIGEHGPAPRGISWKIQHHTVSDAGRQIGLERGAPTMNAGYRDLRAGRNGFQQEVRVGLSEGHRTHRERFARLHDHAALPGLQTRRRNLDVAYASGHSYCRWRRARIHAIHLDVRSHRDRRYGERAP